MGRKPKIHKNKDVHISMDYDLYVQFMDFLDNNKSIGKSELICKLLIDFLKLKKM